MVITNAFNFERLDLLFYALVLSYLSEKQYKCVEFYMQNYKYGKNSPIATEGQKDFISKAVMMILVVTKTQHTSMVHSRNPE